MMSKRGIHQTDTEENIWRCWSWRLEKFRHKPRKSGSNQKLGEARNRLSPVPPEKAWICTHVVFRFLASGTGREWISVFSNHQVCDSFLQQLVKNPLANAGYLGLIPGSGSFSGGGHGNPLQYSCLENPMDREAWQAMVHRITELDTTEWLRT